MAKAIIDPEEVRRFAQDLKRFNGDLHDKLNSLSGRLQTLNQSWRDQESRKFNEEFEQTVKVLRRFMTVSDRHIPFLLRKAERIDDYLQQR